MDLRLFESDELPRPREEMRIQQLEVEPYRDGGRVRVLVTLSAFVERPNFDAFVLNAQHEVVASFSVVEAVAPKMSFTIHLRGAPPGPGYSLHAVLFYSPSVEQREAAGTGAELPDQVVHALDVPFDVPAGVPEQDPGEEGQAREADEDAAG